MKQIILVGLLAAAVHAQPKITAVVDGASYGPFIAPSGFASVFGTNLTDGKEYSASQLPYPTSLGGVEILVCTSAAGTNCVPGLIAYAGPKQINFLAPASLSQTNALGQGVAYAAARVNGVLDSDAARGNSTQIATRQYAPAIFFEGYDCLTDTRFLHPNVSCGLTWVQTDPAFQSDRGAVTDQAGALTHVC